MTCQATVAYDPARILRRSPRALPWPRTTYTATVSGATNATGQTMAHRYSWTFTTASAATCPCSVFSADVGAGHCFGQ